jgi:hypothetical protein
MSDSERVRRQVYDLTVEDLERYPLWEFALDEEDEEGQDEATVKPSEETEVPGYSPGVYILAADATFADGTTAIGYLYSGGPEDGMGCTQPNIVTTSGQVNFWLGWLRFVKDPQARIAEACQILGKDRSSIFPICLRTRPHINGAVMELVVDSFMGGGDKMVPVAVP